MVRLVFFTLLFVLLYLLIFRKKGVEDESHKDDQVKPPRQESQQRQSIVPRGKVHVTENGQAIFSYYDSSESDSHVHQFLDRGLQGGGYTWEALILAAVQIFHPSIEYRLEFDPEADGIAIWSEDQQALNQVAKLVGRIKSDPHFLEACLKHAEEEGYLE